MSFFNPITRIFFGQKLEWNLSIPPQRVAEILASENDGSWFERLLWGGVKSRATATNFTMSSPNIGGIPFSGNTFNHILAGKIIGTPDGSKVTARFRLSLPAFIFAIIWLGIATLIGLTGGIVALKTGLHRHQQDKIQDGLFMAAFPFIGIAAINLFQWFSRRSQAEIRQRICACLDPYRISSKSY